MNKIVKQIGAFLLVALLSFNSHAIKADAYVTNSHGYKTASINIEMRSSYGSVFDKSLKAWNQTDTRAYLAEVVNSDNSIGDGTFPDDWYGHYSPGRLQYGFWGRSTAFTITLNRRLLVNESDNFRQSVMVHELGHALNLGDDPPESPSIMRYDRNRNTLITPQQDDINGVNNYYQ